MTTINNISTNSSNSKLISEKQSLDKDAFLSLLVAQLSNQDPLKPMEDKEFIAQMAQFSTLEQIQNMDKTMGQTNELIAQVGIKVLDQISSESDKMLETNKGILQELINLNNAIKKYDMPTEDNVDPGIEIKEV